MSAELLFDAIESRRTVHYVDVSSSFLLLHDTLLCLDKEIRHIWSSPWSVVKALYLLQRYLPFADIFVFYYREFRNDIGLDECRTSSHATGWLLLVGMIASEALLAIRIWAVWRRNVSIGIGLVVFFLGCWIPTFFIMRSFLDSMIFGPPPIPGYLGCFPIAASDSASIFWSLFLVYDTGAFILITVPYVSSFKAGGRPLFLKAIYRDGVVYYLFIFLASAANIIVTLILPPQSASILYTFERVAHSILTSHAILHIRAGLATDRHVAENGIIMSNLSSASRSAH